MKISPDLRQKFSFSVLFLMGANLLIGSSYRAEQDTWISILFVSAILILWSFIFARISFLQPGKDIFSLLKLLPKWISTPLICVLTFYCFGQAAITLRVYAGFVRIASLQNTDILIILILISLSVWFFLCKENGMLYRFSYLTVIPIVFIVFLLFFFLLPKFRSENLFPVFYNNARAVFHCTAENFAFPFGNIFLLLGIKFCPDDEKKERNVWCWISIVSCAISFIIVLQNILLLGGKLSNILDFPLNFSASLVNVGDFFSRIEVFVSLFFFLSAIIRSSYLTKLVSRGLAAFVSFDPKAISLPLVTVLCGYSAIAFDNTNSVLNFLKIFPYFALPLQLGVPILLWIFVEVISKSEKKIPCLPRSQI